MRDKKENLRKMNLEKFLRAASKPKEFDVHDVIDSPAWIEFRVIDSYIVAIGCFVCLFVWLVLESFFELDIIAITASIIFLIYSLIRAVIFSKSFFRKEYSVFFAFTGYTVQVILLVFAFGIVYYCAGAKFQDGSFVGFWDSVYFSFITWTTIGYGDITPVGVSKFFALLEGLLGYVFMALLIAKILHLVKVKDAKQR